MCVQRLLRAQPSRPTVDVCSRAHIHGRYLYCLQLRPRALPAAVIAHLRRIAWDAPRDQLHCHQSSAAMPLLVLACQQMGTKSRSICFLSGGRLCRLLLVRLSCVLVSRWLLTCARASGRSLRTSGRRLWAKKVSMQRSRGPCHHPTH